MSIKLIAAALFLGIGYLSVQEVRTTEEDLRVDGLVYLKKDGLPFTGTLTINEPPHSASYSFCNGVPCGTWEYRFNGDLIHKGEHINLSAVRSLFPQDSVVIDHWQEGEMLTDPYAPFLSVEILKPLSFFETGVEQHAAVALDLARRIAASTRDVQYDYLTLYYRSDFYNERHFVRYEYQMRKGEPVAKGTESK